MSEETNQYIEPTIGDNLPTESIEQAAERLYPSNPVIIDENITIDANLILRKEWINGANWQKSQPDNRVVVNGDIGEVFTLSETPYTVDEIELFYRMCGANPINAEMSMDIINAIVKYGREFSLKDAVPIRHKWYGKQIVFRPNSNSFRTHLKYKRHYA